MKKNIIIISLIFILPLLAYFILNSTSTTEANVEVAGKPQVLKFTSKMCLDCQTMNNIFKEIFPKYENDIILTEIHVQNSDSFTDSQIEKYNVTLVPTIILIDSKGKQVRRIEGAISKEEMDKCLQGLK